MSVLVDSEKCKGCGLCVSVCPIQAISIIQNKAFIDQIRCNECRQCIDECPESAIHHISENEVHVVKRESSIPYLLKQPKPHTGQIFSSTERKQRAIEKGGLFLHEVKKTIDNFFKIDSPFGISRKGGRIKYRRQKKRHRGGRF